MSNLQKRSILILLVGLTTPATLFAATSNIGFDGLNNLILSFANGVVRSTGYMMFTLATVVFFFGIVQFIWTARQGAEGKGIQKGTQFIKWGLIAIFVMFSLWGIIRFAQGVFGIQGEDTITVPSLNFRPASGGASGSTGGTGIVSPISGSVSNNATYNNCIASGGGAGECRTLSGQSTTNPTSGYTSSQIEAQQQVNDIVTAINQASSQIAAAGGDPNQIGTTPAECVARGGSASTCQTAFGTPVTGSTGNVGFDNCISAGGGVAECRNIGDSYESSGTVGVTGDNSTGYIACVQGGGDAYSCMQMYQTSTGGTVEAWQTSGDGTQGDWGDTQYADYGTESWQTTGNGFDYVDTQTVDLQIDSSGDVETASDGSLYYDCTDYCG